MGKPKMNECVLFDPNCAQILYLNIMASDISTFLTERSDRGVDSERNVYGLKNGLRFHFGILIL